MASNGSDVKYFTAEGIKKMEEELDYLRSVKRGEVAEKIKVARSFGDLSENAEYDEARKEQAFMEGRIQELEAILSTAQVIREEDMPDGRGHRRLHGQGLQRDAQEGAGLQPRGLFRGGPLQGPDLPGFPHRRGACGQARGRDGAGRRSRRHAHPAHREHHPVRQKRTRERESFSYARQPAAARGSDAGEHQRAGAHPTRKARRAPERGRGPLPHHALRPHPPFRADPARL